MSESEITEETPDVVESLSLKLLQQTDLNNSLQQQLSSLHRQLLNTRAEKEDLERDFATFQKQLVAQTNEKVAEANKECADLRAEIEDMSEALFSEANKQVESANRKEWSTKQLNGKLSDTLKSKDNTIEMLQTELSHLKTIISDMQSEIQNNDAETQAPPLLDRQSTISTIQKSTNSLPMTASIQIPDSSLFVTPLLSGYNNKAIPITYYNQFRFDLPLALMFKESLTIIPGNHSESWSIKHTKLFEFILNEIDACVRLDKSPALKYKFNKRSFVTSMLGVRVGIEPLSAATEKWKRNQLEKALNDTEKSDLANDDSSPIGTPMPLATPHACSLCGEKSSEMNFSRLYKMTIHKKEKEVYSLCIICASKWRAIAALLVFVESLAPIIDYSEKDGCITALDKLWHQYLEFISHLSKLYHLRLGMWSDEDVCGSVYGWKNIWIAQSHERKLIYNQTISSSSLDDSLKESATDASISKTKSITENINASTEPDTPQPLSRSTTGSSTSNELPKQRRVSRGLDLRVVSGNRKRMSVNLGLMVSPSPDRNSDENLEDKLVQMNIENEVEDVLANE